MTRSLRRRRGFTLIELLIGIILSAAIGMAMVRLIMSQTRFMDTQEAWRTARGVSRSSLNRLLSDIRLLEAEGGLEAAAAGGQDFTVRVPYAFGVVCASTGSMTTVSLMPVDSTMFAAAGYSGFALRDQHRVVRLRGRHRAAHDRHGRLQAVRSPLPGRGLQRFASRAGSIWHRP